MALLGAGLAWFPIGEGLVRLSYDLPFIFSTKGEFKEVVLIEMDELSHRTLKQDYGKIWDRALHARLLDYLRAEGSGPVVFDVFFSDSGDQPAATQLAAQAMRAHGRVILAAESVVSGKPGFLTTRVIPPDEPLRLAAAKWGLLGAQLDGDEVVRQHFTGRDPDCSLAWAAAKLAGAPVTLSHSEHAGTRWLRYYGPGRSSFQRVSYSEVTNQAAGFYRGKTIFIGGRPATVLQGQEVDQFQTPWRRFGQPLASGLEITATTFLNLVRGDWLRRFPPKVELLLLVGLGILFGGGLACVRPGAAALLALGGVVVIVAAALWLFWERNLWFAWCGIVMVQIPAAFVWSWIGHVRQLQKEKDWLESPLEDGWAEPLAANLSSAPAEATGPSVPVIPDHEMLRCVGRGAYGEVWLARDAINCFHVVKIVRRESFPDDDPYQREFRGVQRFTPISRRHPGFVHILHVGINAAAGYFYYVMEAGDDEQSGQEIEGDTYTPRNLARELRRRGPLPLKECVELGLALTSALEFLHQQGLVHRDIKPSNIIFVHGQPKLADVGLVTTIGLRGRDASYVGTEGYLPPEGPGTVAGDLYALGKVLHEMTVSREVEGTSNSKPESSNLESQQYQLIVTQACAHDPAQRYATAQAMHDALRKLVGAGRGEA